MGDVEVARLEVRHPNEENYPSPRGDKVFFVSGKVRLGKRVDHIVPVERLRAISANQLHSVQLWFVGQSDAYGAIVAKVEASTRRNWVYSARPLCLPGRGEILYLAKHLMVQRPRGQRAIGWDIKTNPTVAAQQHRMLHHRHPRGGY